jgi:hypothetical protein
MTPHLAEQPQQQAREVLLPCPFCGATGDDLLMAVPPGPDHVYCRSCCSSGPVRERIAEANDAWNTRVPAPQGDAGEVAEALVDALPKHRVVRPLEWVVHIDAIAAALQSREQAARAEERERCAKVAAMVPAPDTYTTPVAAHAWDMACITCAAAIRATAGDGR